MPSLLGARKIESDMRPHNERALILAEEKDAPQGSRKTCRCTPTRDSAWEQPRIGGLSSTISSSNGRALLKAIREPVNSRTALSNERFKDEIEAMLARSVRLGTPGRPRKKGFDDVTRQCDFNLMRK